MEQKPDWYFPKVHKDLKPRPQYCAGMAVVGDYERESWQDRRQKECKE